MPVSLLAVAAAALSCFLVGGLWYSPLLFGTLWQRHTGLTDDQVASGMGRVLGGALALAALMAINLAFFLGPDPGAGWGATAGALAGGGWVAAGMGVTYLFERRPLALFLIDGGYHLVSFTVMGLLIGILQ